MNIYFRLVQNTFRECVREPVYFLLLLIGVCLIGILPLFTLYVFRDQIKLVVDSAMAVTLVLGLVTATLCASHTISREMRNGTVLLLLSKPVTRWSFILAKLTGVMAALTMFTLLLGSAGFTAIMVAKDQFRIDVPIMVSYFLLLAVCCAIAGGCNYLKGVSFTSYASFFMTVSVPVFSIAIYLICGAPEDEGFMPPIQYVAAVVLLFPAVWIMGAIAAALATRVGIVANLTVCSLLFLCGLISKYISSTWVKGTGPDTLFSWLPPDMAGPVAEGFKTICGGIARMFLPDWQYFWMADALASHTQVPLAYIAYSFVYCSLYAGFWCLIAIALFYNREVAKDAVN